MKTSLRINQLPASPIRKLVPYAQKAKADGVTVYHLNIGDPDIKTPEVMLDVLRHWDTNPISYALSQGDTDFVTALVWYYHKIGYSFIGREHVQVTTGGSEAIGMAIFATCDPGDEVLVFEPFYANYTTIAAIYGVKLVAVSTTSADGFHLPSQDVIESVISVKTKAILFCNPSNPTGTVYTKAEVEMLITLAKKHGLYLISDEVYREFVYDGKTHVSLLGYMQELPEQIILLDSMSKRYSLCGARLGTFVSMNRELMDGALRIAQSRLSSGMIDQKMAAQLTHVPDSYTTDVQQEYEARRDVIYEGFSKIEGVKIPKPEGAFYSVVTLPVADTEDFCRWLLTDFRDKGETIMFAPAAGFYMTPGQGKHEVRIAYVLEIPKLKRCVQLLAKALAQYNETR